MNAIEKFLKIDEIISIDNDDLNGLEQPLYEAIEDQKTVLRENIFKSIVTSFNNSLSGIAEITTNDDLEQEYLFSKFRLNLYCGKPSLLLDDSSYFYLLTINLYSLDEIHNNKSFEIYFNDENYLNYDKYLKENKVDYSHKSNSWLRSFINKIPLCNRVIFLEEFLEYLKIDKKNRRFYIVNNSKKIEELNDLNSETILAKILSYIGLVSEIALIDNDYQKFGVTVNLTLKP